MEVGRSVQPGTGSAVSAFSILPLSLLLNAIIQAFKLVRRS
jgi:hypothetical protein